MYYDYVNHAALHEARPQRSAYSCGWCRFLTAVPVAPKAYHKDKMIKITDVLNLTIKQW